MANFIFNEAKKLIMNRAAGTTARAPYIELETNSAGQAANTTADALRVLLVTVQLTEATHGDAGDMDALEAISGYAELSGSLSNYTTGGGASSGGTSTVGRMNNAVWKSSTTTGASGFSYLEADDIAWGAIAASTTEDIKGAVLWYADGNLTGATANTDIPIAYFDWPVGKPDGSNLTMQWGTVTGAATSSGKGVVLKLDG
tara:strand:+ start:1882 stop:2484 length:603 start_codon:yes stop_codon:yes gene_type:complete